MATDFELRRFSVDDYSKMLDSGILTEQERVELIDGEVRCMSPIGTRHIGVVIYLSHQFGRMLGDAAIVSTQNPIQLDDYSEPQPDVTILRWRSDFYRKSKARPQDVLLLIEVADSSLNYDRHEKLPRYAAAGIPEVWIVDVAEDRYVIEQYSVPQGDQYLSKELHSIGDTIVSRSLSDAIQLSVADVFGENDAASA